MVKQSGKVLCAATARAAVESIQLRVDSAAKLNKPIQLKSFASQQAQFVL
jgi:hypothetical protein